MKAKRLVLLFSICGLLVLTTGCTATWISLVGQAIPTIQTLLAAILAFVAALAGKTVSAEVSAAIQKIAADATATLNNIQQLVNDYKNDPDLTTVGKIKQLFNDVVINLGSILSGFSITDSATVSKLTQIVGLAVMAIQAALALIPLFGAAGTATVNLNPRQLKTLQNTHNLIKREYNEILKDPSGSDVVDAALQTLPRL